jgi:hypothetical protein
LKDFLTSCLTQFEVYIWFITRHYNIDKHLDKIKEKTHITLDLSRVLGQESCQKNDHFLAIFPKKPIFYENLDVFFSRFLDMHARNTFLVDDITYKSIFNDFYCVIFLELFEGSRSDGDYLFSIVLLYLVSFHSFGFNVQTYVRHNRFWTIRNISHNDPYYNTLFQSCNNSCEPTFVQKQN